MWWDNTNNNCWSTNNCRPINNCWYINNCWSANNCRPIYNFWSINYYFYCYHNCCFRTKPFDALSS